MILLVSMSYLLSGNFISKAYAQDEETSEEDLSYGRMPSQSGEIKLETEGPKRDPYKEGQEAAIEFFRKFSGMVPSLAAGNAASPGMLSDDSLNYLSGVYLYCAVNAGVCPLILDSILEVDVINSKISGSAACPNLKKLWGHWVKNGLEERHKFMVKTSFINEHSKFISQQRPRYLKCEETIKNLISTKEGTSSFFKDRYKPGSPHSKLAGSMLQLLEQVKAKIPNVFTLMGARGESSNSAAQGSRSKPAKRR